jgi:hypothetical protein
MSILNNINIVLYFTLHFILEKSNLYDRRLVISTNQRRWEQIFAMNGWLTTVLEIDYTPQLTKQNTRLCILQVVQNNGKAFGHK